MFNLSGSEIVFILLAALVLLGPEKLPETLRKVGRVYAEVRKISNGFQSELRNVLDEPTKEIRNAFEEPAKELRNTAEQAKSAFSLQQLNPNGKPGPQVSSPTPAAEGAAEPVSDAFGAVPPTTGAPTAEPPTAEPPTPGPSAAAAPTPADADEATA